MAQKINAACPECWSDGPHKCWDKGNKIKVKCCDCEHVFKVDAW